MRKASSASFAARSALLRSSAIGDNLVATIDNNCVVVNLRALRLAKLLKLKSFLFCFGIDASGCNRLNSINWRFETLY